MKTRPAIKTTELTPTNGLVFEPFRALYIGTGGDVTLRDYSGNTTLFTGVPSGYILPVEGDMVMATGTTASGIVALA